MLFGANHVIFLCRNVCGKSMKVKVKFELSSLDLKLLSKILYTVHTKLSTYYGYLVVYLLKLITNR